MDSAYVYSASLLVVALILGYVIVRLPVIRKSFLPTALASGVLLLIFGPEIAGSHFPQWQLPAQFYDIWSLLPKYLINIVFACLLLAKPLLSLRKMWRLAGPQIAFGQMMAWGQYALGGLLVLLVLTPFFGMPAIGAALIEVSFEGGHGTVAGMTPVFEELGFRDGQELAVALATASLLTALTSGIILINWGRKKGYLRSGNIVQVMRNEVYHRQIINALHKKGIRLRRHVTPARLLHHVALIALGVFFGWLMHYLFVALENATWAEAGVKIFGYLPVFPFCMFGGLLAQSIWRRLGLEISRELIEILSALALSVLVMTAIGTMSLEFLSENAAAFGLLYLTGVAWIIGSFLLLARRMFKRYWFQNAIIDMGQSMGMTATGLLFAQMTDPKNRTNAVEAFGYKQLLFEPFMGGGIVTALAMPVILAIGLPLFTVICGAITIVWMCAGLFYFGRR